MQVHPITPKPKPKPSITPKPSANPSANPSPLALRTDGSASRLAQERQARHPETKVCAPWRGPPLASAATATRTACSKSVRVRVLGLPPARWLRLLATPILLASAPPGLEAQVCGPPGRMHRALLRARPEADMMRTCSVLAHFRHLSTLASPVRAALPSPLPCARRRLLLR